MRPTLKTEALPLALVGAVWLLTAWFWPNLPPAVPIHWGLNGKPDDWLAMPWGGLFGALMTTGLYLLTLLLPAIDPRAQNWEGFAKVYPTLRVALVGFGLAMTHLTLSAAVRPGQELAVNHLMAFLGVLFMVVGNALPKIRSNFFVGVRTPWTLSSDEVWYRTHRFAGKLMVALGLLILLASPLPTLAQITVVVGGTLIMVTFSFAYSLWLYRKLGPKSV